MSLESQGIGNVFSAVVAVPSRFLIQQCHLAWNKVLLEHWWEATLQVQTSCRMCLGSPKFDRLMCLGVKACL